MKEFTEIVIIFNPNSNGNAKTRARWLHTQIEKKYPKQEVAVLETKYAGHATEITKQFKGKNLVISVSGDGGYHDVVNGAMALPYSSRPVCAVFPAGNANDHARAHGLSGHDFVQAIGARPRRIDLLGCHIKPVSDTAYTRYAHSYIGFGLSSEIAAELNRHSLNFLLELWLVAKNFSKYKAAHLRVNNRKSKYSSLICSNIPHMAKYLSINADAEFSNGLFGVIEFGHRYRITTLLSCLKAMVWSIKPDYVTQSLPITLLESQMVQLDGEVISLLGRTHVIIKSHRNAIKTLTKNP